MYVFISHSSVNAQIAEKICSKIEYNGHKCFIAPRDIRMGHEYAAEIMTGLDNSNVMILLLSKEAVESPHVLREIERAVSKKIPIIVYKLEEVELSKSLEYFLMTHQWITTPQSDYEDVIEAVDSLDGRTKQETGTENVSVKKKVRKQWSLPVVIAMSACLIAGAIIAVAVILNKGKNNDGNDKGTEYVGDDITNPNDNDEPTVAPAEIELGDRINLGKYNNADIEWRVLNIAEDGKTAVLISQNILCMKAFDAADGGKAGYYNGESQYGQDAISKTDLEIQKIAWGNSTWADSTLRTWLNSSKEVVKYNGEIPSVQAFTDRYNDYSTEPGFLYGFTEKELDAIVETTIVTDGNDASKEETIETTDKVYLLSVEELVWFNEADIPLFAKPTPEAVENNEDPTYKEIIQDSYKMDTYFWWLRDPVEGYSAKAYSVSIGISEVTTDNTYYVSVPSIGVRPVITVDIGKLGDAVAGK